MNDGDMSEVDTTNIDEIQRLATEIRLRVGASPLVEGEQDLVFLALLQVIRDEREACIERIKAFEVGPNMLMARQIRVSLEYRSNTIFGEG